MQKKVSFKKKENIAKQKVIQKPGDHKEAKSEVRIALEEVQALAQQSAVLAKKSLQAAKRYDKALKKSGMV